MGMQVDEAMRRRRFPGIAFRGGNQDRQAWVVGTSLDVWEIIEAFQSYGAIEPLVAESDLTERQVKLALAYYGGYRDEVDAAVEENQRPLNEVRRVHPAVDVIEIDD
jgi:uncharacterized protein (DUF433 family)